MSQLRKRTLIFSSILVPVLLVVAACAGSTSTPEPEAATPAADVSAEAPSKPAAKPAVKPAETKAKPAARPAPEPAPKPAPRFVTVNVPAGTELEVELEDPLSSGTNQAGDPVRARLVGDLVVGGRRVAPAGAELRGSVTAVEPLKKFGGQPKIAVVFESLDIDGESVEIFGSLNAEGSKQAGKDAAKIGGGAAAGAVLGHQVDDKKGSKIGALVGGAIGTAVAAKTGKELELPAGEVVLVVLESETPVRVDG